MNSPRMTLEFAPGRIALRSLMVVGAAVVLGVLFNSFSPTGIAWTGAYAADLSAEVRRAGLIEVSLEEAQRVVRSDSGFLVVDARPLADYDLGHLPGALSTPTREMAISLTTIQSAAGKGDKVLIYCSGLHCSDALHLGVALKQAGFTAVHVFPLGFEAWKEAGLEIER